MVEILPNCHKNRIELYIPEERANDIFLCSKLILEAYQRLHERVQHLKFEVNEETKMQKNSNNMVSNQPKKCPSYKGKVSKCHVKMPAFCKSYKCL